MSKVRPARERILSAASRLFQKRGYTEIGINEIISESGTAKATFYSNFSSKEILGEVWLESIHEQSIGHHKKLLERGGNPRDILSKYFQELEVFLEEGDYRGCPYTNTKAVIKCGEVLLDKQVCQHKASMRSFFKSVALASGLSDKVAQSLGDKIFVIYSGATTEAQNLKNMWPVEVAKSTSLQLWDLAHSE